MSQILDRAAVPALRRMDFVILRPEEADVLVVAVPTPRAGQLLVLIEANDQQQEVMVGTGVCTVPLAQRAQMAVLIASLNGMFNGVKFSLNNEGIVDIDVFVELACGGNAEALITLAIKRLLYAIGKTYEEIVGTAFPPKGKRARPTLMERQLSEVLRRADV